MHYNVVNNNYQQVSKVLFSFVSNEQFGQFITIAPQTLAMLKATSVEFSFIEVWFTDQNNGPLEIEVNVNIILTMRYSLEPRKIKYVKGYGFLLFARKFMDKYGKKLTDTVTKTGIDAAKTTSKRVVQKAAEATGDLIGNKTKIGNSWVNPHSIVAWMSRNSLLKTGAKSEVQVTATGLEPTTT